MDFTLKTYKSLIETLASQTYSFQTFQDFIKNPNEKSIVLRHDVDWLPENALRMAGIEKEYGILGTYFFRIVKESCDEDIIKRIAKMGHEIGYHYENLAEIGKGSGVRSQKSGVRRHEAEDMRQKSEVRRQEKETFSTNKQINNSSASIFELALEDFEKNLERLRKVFPVKTICLHGSPTSKYDSRDLWKVYDYRDYGIIAEPYFDVDFTKVLYLTDTGRRWDGERFNIRDRVVKETGVRRQKSEVRRQERETFSTKKQINDLTGSLHSTYDIIKALKKGKLPDQIMINTHPQRWTDNYYPWVKELIWQNVKNIVKRVMVKKGS